MTCCVFTGFRMPDWSCKTALTLGFTNRFIAFFPRENSLALTHFEMTCHFFLGSVLCNGDNPAPLITQSNSAKNSPQKECYGQTGQSRRLCPVL